MFTYFPLFCFGGKAQKFFHQMSEQGYNQDTIWDFYQNEMAESFEGSSARITYLLNQIPKGSRCLNIGVGSGILEYKAHQLGIDVYSLDPSDKSIQKLNEKFPKRATVGFSQEMPFENASFDCVIMSEVLEHLSDEVLTSTIIEVRRVLKHGGVFIGTVPSNENLALNQIVSPSDGFVFHRWGHLQSFNKERLKKMLTKSFSRTEVTEKLFVNWATLNWKGKVIGFLRLSAFYLGSPGAGRNLFFKAW